MATLKETILNSLKLFWQNKIKQEFNARDTKLFFTTQPYFGKSTYTEGDFIELTAFVAYLNNLDTSTSIGDIHYQWQYKKVDDVSWTNASAYGSDTPVFQFSARPTLTGRAYRCMVTHGNNTYYSREATLTVTQPT